MASDLTITAGKNSGKYLMMCTSTLVVLSGLLSEIQMENHDPGALSSRKASCAGTIVMSIHALTKVLIMFYLFLYIHKPMYNLCIKNP